MIVVKSKRMLNIKKDYLTLIQLISKILKRNLKVFPEREVNAMLLFPYLDYTKGLSFLLITMD